MAPVIYTSPYPSVPLYDRSLFTHLLSVDRKGFVGHWPGNYPAFTDAKSGAGITRAQLRALALSLAYGIKHHPTARANRGDVALVFSPNSLSWAPVLFGCFAAGVRATLANSDYNSRELAYQYKDSGAYLIFTIAEKVPTVRQMFLETGVRDGEKRIVIMDSLAWAGGPGASTPTGLVGIDELLSLGSLTHEENFDGQGDETTLMCYSSGTTGQPKGVETTHNNLTAEVDIVQAGAPDAHGRNQLAILPLYHIYGVALQLLRSLRAGLHVVIMARFDLIEYCANIQKYNIYLSMVVPPVLVALARHPAVSKYDFSSLSIMMSGAAPLGADLVRQVKARLHGLGSKVFIMQGYGLTETSPVSHCYNPDHGEGDVGSIGPLLANLEARLVDEDGADAKAGKPGELWIRGPTVMKGYLNKPEATAGCMTPDGWFQTGDVAVRDAKTGYYTIVDRKKELIKYKGFQVPPAELESVLLSHPGVADAAVIGIYDEKEATELPRAYIVPASAEKDTAAFEKGVAQWIRTKVAKHKYLRGGVVVIDAIPKSAAGKILRRQLRDRAQEELKLSGGVPLKAKL
ncbi:AMP binding protein [Cylindrobasidium torrendii FP15055 ss-10]|uniref:AMP binding protein n=1 Tax=Cylindrobasidium torrendii FP15055 ss-10 TaxID=1314674 RepID=A0A0D7BCI6_9AGAR|nr:AMP binding protein [Cylindrobasidium torrendii FP15055 ss-10]